MTQALKLPETFSAYCGLCNWDGELETTSLPENEPVKCPQCGGFLIIGKRLVKNVKTQTTLSSSIKHDLDLILNEETIGFFSVTLAKKFLLDEFDESGDIPMPIMDGKRVERIVPTYTIYADNFSAEERLHFARVIMQLAKRIRDSVLSK